MADTHTRLLEARRELHRLGLHAEQYRLHLAELGAHPAEAERARAVLEKLTTDLARQRSYCELLEKAYQREDEALTGVPRVA